MSHTYFYTERKNTLDNSPQSYDDKHIVNNNNSLNSGTSNINKMFSTMHGI